MKGDFSRFSFNRIKRFTRVLKQQGRVDLDADWNEHAAIQAYLRETGQTDVIGQAGAPSDSFRISARASGSKLNIAAGHIYVDGNLVENDSDVDYDGQPFLRQSDEAITPPAIGSGNDELLRTDLVYLEAWEQHITAYDEPTIREVALGGPDTTTRLRMVWRVRLRRDVGNSAECDAPLASFPPAATGAGRLTVAATPPDPSSDPCIIEPDAGGYRGLENRLYRVEIHTVTPLPPTFKWSLENGAVVYRVKEIIDAQRLLIEREGRDESLRLRLNDRVELLSAEDELRGLPGVLTTVSAAPNGLQISVANDISRYTGRHDVIVRRWSGGPLPITGAAVNLDDPGTGLRTGISVRFPDGSGAAYRSGDAWTFTARARGTIEELTSAPPREVVRHYARLGLVRWWRRNQRFLVRPRPGSISFDPDLAIHWTWDASPTNHTWTWTFTLDEGQSAQSAANALRDNNTRITGFANATASDATLTLTLNAPNPDLLAQIAQIPIVNSPQRVAYVDDCRARFRPLTALDTLQLMGGDGQTGLPSHQLPQPLRVRVSRGGLAVVGAAVEFVVETGGGSLAVGGPASSSVIVETDAEGYAEASWALGGIGSPWSQRVRARLKSDPAQEVHFAANLSVTLQLVGGDGQEGRPDTQLPQPLRVRVSSDGQAVEGATVEFVVETGDGSLAVGGPASSSVIVETDAEGYAEASWALGGIGSPWSQRVRARLKFDPAQKVHFAANLSVTLQLMGGDGQTGGPGAALPQPLRVRVSSDGQAVEGATVEFVVETGDGSLAVGGPASSSVIVETDAEGYAEASWALGGIGSPWSQGVRARLRDAPAQKVRFTANLSLTLQLMGGDGQTGGPGAALPQPLRVRVSSDGQAVAGARVEFTVLAGGGTLTGGGATGVSVALDSGPDGYAEADWTLGPLGSPWSQGVRAWLKDDPAQKVHFAASLSIAEQVAYTPSKDCTALATATTVQEAIDLLCERTNCTCTLTAVQEEGWEKLFDQIPPGGDAEVCFTKGTFELKTAVLIKERGHLKLTGAGAGSRIVVRGESESALIFDNCASVYVRDLAVQTDFVEQGDTDHEGLNGSLMFRNCGAVELEAVVVQCGHATFRAASCVNIINHNIEFSDLLNAPARGLARVRGCRFLVGHAQIGVMVINSARSQIEDNIIELRVANPKDLPLLVERLREDNELRAEVRRLLISDIEYEWRGEQGGNRIQQSVGEFELNFRVHPDLIQQELWPQLIKDSPPSNIQTLSEARAYLLWSADALLIEPGRYDFFNEWLTDVVMKEDTSALYQGIVIAGQESQEIRVINNTIIAAAQGIHIGLSQSDQERPLQAQDVQITGNTVYNIRPPSLTREAHGIYLGNFETATISMNRVRARLLSSTSHLPTFGMEIVGLFGERLIVRDNEARNYSVGIYANASSASLRENNLWVVRENLATRNLNPADAYIVENNMDI